jgi:hypothetical protein
MKGFIKDPDATLDYAFDWGPWLDGDVLNGSDWYVDSGTLTKVGGGESWDAAGLTRCYVQGGTAGENCTIRNRVTTLGGRTDERSIEIRIRNR